MQAQLCKVHNSDSLYEGAEHEEDAGEHPGLDGRQPLRLGRVRRHRVEDVDEHQEEGDEERHPAGDHVHRDEEGDPGHDDEQAWRAGLNKYFCDFKEILGVLTGGKVVGDDVGGDVSGEHHFKAGEGEVA